MLRVSALHLSLKKILSKEAPLFYENEYNARLCPGGGAKPSALSYSLFQCRYFCLCRAEDWRTTSVHYKTKNPRVGIFSSSRKHFDSPDGSLSVLRQSLFQDRRRACAELAEALRDQDLHLGLEVLRYFLFRKRMDYTMLPEGASHYSL